MAMGKTWHPDHFKCSHCHRCIEGSSFFESEGQPYCERDYGKLFASVCAHCNKPVIGVSEYLRFVYTLVFKESVVALGRSWHPEHFLCAHCKTPIRGQNFMTEAGRIYCPADYRQLFAPRCGGCGKPVTGQSILALEKQWHSECFVCQSCNTPFETGTFYKSDGELLCGVCVNPKGSSRQPSRKASKPGPMSDKKLCHACNQAIEGKVTIALGKEWHPDHFVCDHCHNPMASSSFYEKDGKAYCKEDYQKLFGSICASCGEAIEETVIQALGKTWHPDHFRCAHCGSAFGKDGFLEKDGRPYCFQDYGELFGNKCFRCHKPVLGNALVALDHHWHKECFVCQVCEQPILQSSFFKVDGMPMCQECANKQ